MADKIDMILTCIGASLAVCHLAFLVFVIILMSKGYLIGGRGIPEASPKRNADEDDKDNTNQ